MSKRQTKSAASGFAPFAGVRRAFRALFDLVHGTDVQGTIATINEGIDMKGYKTWILMCGAMLASIGLNTNSAAVIIGAMLISPLMNPILGIGLGVGINDREMLGRGLQGLGIAVAASLFASCGYFLLTPLTDPTPEILSRIKPSILDVGVAVFGGIAGIIAISRDHQTNAIPGVAIATALMPPLCTAGYGLATAHWTFFFGAFYLFFINAFFISLSTYVIVRLLRFPYKEFVNADDKAAVKLRIIIFAVIVTLPSAVMFYFIIDEYREKKLVELFIAENFRTDVREVLRWELQPVDSIRYLKLYIVGEALGPGRIDTLQRNLSQSSIGDLRLKFVQMNVPREERRRIASEITTSVLQTVELQNREQEEQRRIIDSLAAVVQARRSDTLEFDDISHEARAVFPELEKIGFGTLNITDFSRLDTIPTFVVLWDKRLRNGTRQSNNRKLRDFLLLRSGLDTLVVMEPQ